MYSNNALREEAAARNLQYALVFLCKDNSTIATALVKDNSSSEKLFELTLEVQKIEMQEGVRVLVSHVSGKHMKKRH
jgi:hypothetical protein